jgi:hypothetical protein
MRFEIVVFIIAGVIITNIYTEGKFVKNMFSYKKYYKIGGVVFGTLFILWLFKKNPLHAKNIVMSSNEYLKYLPIDRNTSNLISPILDFTSKSSFADQQSEYNYPVMQMNSVERNQSTARIMNSGKYGTKRSVSESKKKFVAHRQNWKCEKCKRILPASFEVDHIIRLQHGGSNHVDNLVALCRDCHGEKTLIENL